MSTFEQLKENAVIDTDQNNISLVLNNCQANYYIFEAAESSVSGGTNFYKSAIAFAEKYPEIVAFHNKDKSYTYVGDNNFELQEQDSTAPTNKFIVSGSINENGDFIVIGYKYESTSGGFPWEPKDPQYLIFSLNKIKLEHAGRIKLFDTLNGKYKYCFFSNKFRQNFDLFTITQFNTDSVTGHFVRNTTTHGESLKPIFGTCLEKT